MSYDIYTGLLKIFNLPVSVDSNVCFIHDNKHSKFNQLKSKYPIESIAGSGDDLSKAINIMHWVSGNIYHKGDYNNWDIPQNSLSLLDYAYDKGVENGINCVCLAKILAECLLAIGLKAKQVFLMPCSPYDGDNHVVTHVFIKKMNKWVMLDPTFNAYLTNEKDQYLSILDLRSHLANQEPVFFNKEAKYNDDEWNEASAIANIEYFAKNLFYFAIPETSSFGMTEPYNNHTILLSPQGYDVKYKQICNIEYRIKRYGDSPQAQKWLEETKKEEICYCSANDFEASLNTVL